MILTRPLPCTSALTPPLAVQKTAPEPALESHDMAKNAVNGTGAPVPGPSVCGRWGDVL